MGDQRETDEDPKNFGNESIIHTGRAMHGLYGMEENLH